MNLVDPEEINLNFDKERDKLNKNGDLCVCFVQTSCRTALFSMFWNGLADPPSRKHKGKEKNHFICDDASRIAFKYQTSLQNEHGKVWVL